MKIRFLQPAERELGEAVEYYEAQKPGLGFELFKEIWAVIERIEQYPEAWQPLSQRARRCQTNRFPYGVTSRLTPLPLGIYSSMFTDGLESLLLSLLGMIEIPPQLEVYPKISRHAKELC